MGLAGQAFGLAVARLLYGQANPGGKLTESWPFRYEDCPQHAYYGKQAKADYREGVHVGYRYYDSADVPVRYPFGFGLSYTSFAYSDLSFDGQTLSVTITNSGHRAGSEIVQLYVTPPQNGMDRPAKELRDFIKIFLCPGESRSVAFELTDRWFAVWSEGWFVPGGTYTLAIGGSSTDLPLKTTLRLRDKRLSHIKDPATTSDPSVDPTRAQKPFTMNHSLNEMKASSRIARMVYKIVRYVIARQSGSRRDDDDPTFRMLLEAGTDSPLRSLQMTSGIRGGLFEGLLTMINGRFLRGLAKMIFG